MSILASIIAGIIAFMVGALWYTVLFGKLWQREVGITDEQIKAAGSGTPQMVTGLFVEILVSLLVFFLLSHTDLNNFCAGAVIGLVSIFSALKNYFFEMKSFKLIAINESYKLICIMIMTLAAHFFG